MRWNIFITGLVLKKFVSEGQRRVTQDSARGRFQYYMDKGESPRYYEAACLSLLKGSGQNSLSRSIAVRITSLLFQARTLSLECAGGTHRFVVMLSSNFVLQS